MNALVPLLAALAVVTAFGCGDGDRPLRLPRPGVAFDAGDDGAAAEEASCTDGRARWVYVVDNDNTLIRFEPDSLTFTDIGVLACDPTSDPFSMSVDRNAVAWVLYENGRLFAASTEDATCTPTTFEPHQAGFELFGMGFATDDGDDGAETLYVAGAAASEIGPTGRAQLATIDLATLRLTARGRAFTGFPELTGTGTGQLWGFFPGAVPTARQIDKTEGTPIATLPIDAISGGDPQSWAFAFWGGRYYVFLRKVGEPSTNVYRLSPDTMTSERVIDGSGRDIVGAGVSTCAPTDLI